MLVLKHILNLKEGVWIGMTEKVFLRIVDDYLLEYDGDFFNMHKPSDIRVLVYILNRDNGFSDQECEYNEQMRSLRNLR